MAALREGRIAGAAMDVGRAPDQMPTPALAAPPNVIATPHIGGLTPPAIEHQAFETVRQVDAIVGRGARGAVNPEHWTRRPDGQAASIFLRLGRCAQSGNDWGRWGRHGRLQPARRPAHRSEGCRFRHDLLDDGGDRRRSTERQPEGELR